MLKAILLALAAAAGLLYGTHVKAPTAHAMGGPGSPPPPGCPVNVVCNQ